MTPEEKKQFDNLSQTDMTTEEFITKLLKDREKNSLNASLEAYELGSISAKNNLKAKIQELSVKAESTEMVDVEWADGYAAAKYDVLALLDPKQDKPVDLYPENTEGRI